MRLRTLLIEKYGNLERTELSFDPAPGCLNLVLAPNGAGKSVLRRAFHDLLFGIPLQSDMKFRFDYPGMHLHADAVSMEGADYSFGWQRKAGRVFPHAAADPAASRWLAELLAAVTPRQVEMLFALDTERLRSGGRDLAAGDSTLGSALLSGTGELAPVRALRRSLDERRVAIWERSKNSRLLNAALSRLAAASKQRRDAVQTPRSLGALQAEREATRARKQDAADNAAAAQARLGRLNRIELTRAPLAALADAAAWLTGHGDAAVLPDGLGDQLSQARHAASLAATRLDAARAQLEEAEARAAAIVRDDSADALDAELARLPGALGDAATKRRDSLARAAERAAALAQIVALLREIGSAVPPAEAGSLIRTLPEMEAAREKISQHTVATTTLTLARTRLDKAQADMALLDSEAAAAPVTAPDGLDLLLGEIRRTRDPLAHAAEIAQAVRVAAAAEMACLARLPGWIGTADDLVALTPATEATYARLAEMAGDAEARLRSAAAERDRLQAQRGTWEASLAALRQQAVPDAAALATARAARDRGWQLIYARAFAHAPDEAAERGYGGGDALPIAFERHMRAADAVADARIRELARVEQGGPVGRGYQRVRGGLDRSAGGRRAGGGAAKRRRRPVGGGLRAAAPAGGQHAPRRFGPADRAGGGHRRQPASGTCSRGAGRPGGGACGLGRPLGSIAGRDHRRSGDLAASGGKPAAEGEPRGEGGGGARDKAYTGGCGGASGVGRAGGGGGRSGPVADRLAGHAAPARASGARDAGRDGKGAGRAG